MSNGIVKIHGREYKTVAKRVQEFREEHPDWSIVTELVNADDSMVIMKAAILDHDGRILGTGYAEENRSASQINKTSALENCETSAIGRALAACGYAGSEYASANEVQNAIEQQKVKIPLKTKNEFMAQVLEALSEGKSEDLHALWSEWGADEKVVLWGLFNSQQRSSMKKLMEN
jgi:hypothetical protein